MHDGCCVHVNRRRPVGALQWIVLASADSICGPRRARRLVFGEIGAGVGPGRIVRICAGLAVLQHPRCDQRCEAGDPAAAELCLHADVSWACRRVISVVGRASVGSLRGG